MKPVARKTLASLIAEQIRREIVRGNLKASQRLPSEQELSSDLHVGRPTLREALRILEGQGWVKIQFSTGVFVSDPENLADRMSSYYTKEGILDLLDSELAQLVHEGREIPEIMRTELPALRESGKSRDIEELIERLQQLPTASLRRAYDARRYSIRQGGGSGPTAETDEAVGPQGSDPWRSAGPLQREPPRNAGQRVDVERDRAVPPRDRPLPSFGSHALRSQGGCAR